MMVIITFSSCCDNLWKSKSVALEKPGKCREFFSSYFVATHMPTQTGGGETQPERSTTPCQGRGLCSVFMMTLVLINCRKAGALGLVARISTH